MDSRDMSFSDNLTNFGSVICVGEDGVAQVFCGKEASELSKPHQADMPYQAEPLNFEYTDDDDDISAKIRRMKQIGRTKSGINAFMAEAEYMKNVTDCYKHPKTVARNYYVYELCPDRLSVGELRTYYTWRTKVFNGQYETADYIYLLLYVTELINGIHGFTDDGIIDELINLYSSYQKDEYFVRLKYTHNISLLELYMKDYVILHKTSRSLGDIYKIIGSNEWQKQYEYNALSRDRYDTAPLVLEDQSAYKFTQANIYSSEYAYLYMPCIDFVFRRISDMLAKHDLDLFDLLYKDTVKRLSIDWYPYSGNPYIIKEIKDFDITMPNGMRYMRCNYRFIMEYWYECRNNIFRHVFGYAIKLTESELRNHLLFPPRIKANPKKASEVSPKLTYEETRLFTRVSKLFLSDEMTDLIKNAVSDFYTATGLEEGAASAKKRSARNKTDETEPRPVEVTIDSAKFDRIRSGAEYLTDILVVDESDDNDTSPNDEAVTKTAANVANDENQIISSDNTFSDICKTAISILLDGEDKSNRLNKLALKNGMTTDMLLDSVNEAALGIIGDNIIDTAGDPGLYEDYIEEIKQLMKEGI